MSQSWLLCVYKTLSLSLYQTGSRLKQNFKHVAAILQVLDKFEKKKNQIVLIPSSYILEIPRWMSRNVKHVAAILQVLEQFENVQNVGLSLDPVC